jgi:Signal transduction histidine kinase
VYQIFCLYSKRFQLIALLLFLCTVKNHAQTNKTIDSLQTLAESSTGVAQFDFLYQIALQHYQKNDLESALDKFTSAQKIAFQAGDSFRIVKSTRAKFQMLRRLERAPDGLDELLFALPIARRNVFTDEVESILNSLAITYTYQANYDKALEYHFQNLVLREAGGDHAAIRTILNNIGIVYFKLRNYPKALEYYLLAIEHDSQVVNSDFRDQLLINTALCYNQLKKFDEARRLLERGLAYCSPNCNQSAQLHGEFGLGVSYYGQKLDTEAKAHFKKSLTISRQIEDIRFQAENLVYLAHIHVRNGEFDSASFALKHTEQIAGEHGFNELLIETFKEYSNLYSLQLDYRNASIYQQKYINLKDSIYSGELIEKIAKITTNFQERVNLQTIADKEETIARQRTLNLAIAVIAVLACSLILVLYHSIKVKRKVNADLSDAKAIIEDQNKLLRSSNVSLNEELKEKNIDLQKANDSLHRVNEELDNFIYKTSHDIRGPLASLKGMCNVALMDVKDPLALNYLNKLDITAEKLNTILTRLLIVNQINNSVLNRDRIDFQSIVDDILMLERKKGIPKRLAINKTICSKTVFYSDAQFVRIILENLIDNAIKFYNDSQRISPFVTINIGGTEEFVSINVIDNGIGISEVHPNKIFQMFSRASERSETGGIGLYITKTAAEKLGGSVHLKTTPEGYTEFYVKLPYSDSRARPHGSSLEIAS